MKILFFGCDDFAATNLKRLIADGHKVLGLVTQPDKPKGRGMHLVPSSTKELALAQGIEVFQPAVLKYPAVIEKLRSFDADLFVVIAYGKLLPEEILAIPRHFCMNLHASLLPKYRGAAPINWAVINGETETGVTLMKMNPAMDGGDIIVQDKCVIPDDMTSSQLRADLANMGAALLSATIPRIKAGDYSFEKQDEGQATHAPKMHKDLGHIRWEESAQKIHDLVRGTQPWPGAFTFWRGNRLKVLEATATVAQRKGKPGEIVELHKDGFYVQAADCAVLIKRVHPANSHAMDARAFLAGHRLVLGDVLG
ncbi:MAG: methionyl-tRNA formyltransferase [Candidatus Omnitrophica bacterium]|nr:methionyl-tRNA formyltransferase [Candidatus Omnitrophota bacterium]